MWTQPMTRFISWLVDLFQYVDQDQGRKYMEAIIDLLPHAMELLPWNTKKYR